MTDPSIMSTVSCSYSFADPPAANTPSAQHRHLISGPSSQSFSSPSAPNAEYGIFESMSTMNAGQLVVGQLDRVQDSSTSICLLPLNRPSAAINTMIPPSVSSSDGQSGYQVLNIFNAASSGNGQTAISNEQKNQSLTMVKLTDSEQEPKVKLITHKTMKRGRHIPSAEKPFVCTTCGKGYKYLCNYRSHCKIHTDAAFVCGYCNKRFGRKSNYKEHVRIHTGEAPYKCEICKRTFKQHHGWKDHLRVHTGEKPYSCTICGKRFTVGHNLNVHMRIHTGERPYSCTICKKSYRQKSAFNSHLKNIHKLKTTKKKSDADAATNSITD